MADGNCNPSVLSSPAFEFVITPTALVRGKSPLNDFLPCFLPGKRLSPRGYCVRHSPFFWGGFLPKPLRHRPGGPPGFASGPPAPPEFQPRCRRSRLRRHQRHRRKGIPPLDGPVWKWLRHDHAGFPEFRLVGCNPGDPPPTWSYLQPLTRPAELASDSISAAEMSVVECAWRWVPSSRPPAASFQNKSFGRPWGGFLGAPLLKALSSPLAGIALVGLAPVSFREDPDS